MGVVAVADVLLAIVPQMHPLRDLCGLQKEPFLFSLPFFVLACNNRAGKCLIKQSALRI